MQAGAIAARPISSMVLADGDGRPSPIMLAFPADVAQADADENGHAGGMIYLTALLALSFCHCKNVRIEERRQPRQQVRAAARQGRALVTYRTLVIDPDHAAVRHEQDRVKRGEITPKALHIVRGHFAEYTAERPLFGKYSGRYFIPMHTRGTLKAGAVVKDYAVKSATR